MLVNSGCLLWIWGCNLQLSPKTLSVKVHPTSTVLSSTPWATGPPESWKQREGRNQMASDLTPMHTFGDQWIYNYFVSTCFQQIHDETWEMATVFFSGHTDVLRITLWNYDVYTTTALAPWHHKPGASPRNKVVDGPNQVMCSVWWPGRHWCGLLQTSGLHCRLGVAQGAQVAQWPR